MNTASISGLFADFAMGACNAAKAGVVNVTRVTAIEYAARGIRVNCVCPGAIVVDGGLTAQTGLPSRIPLP